MLYVEVEGHGCKTLTRFVGESNNNSNLFQSVYNHFTQFSSFIIVVVFIIAYIALLRNAILVTK